MTQHANIRPVSKQSVVLSLDDVGLRGELDIPVGARSVILFVDQSDLSDSGSMTRHIAKKLNEFGYATLLFDLMTADEEAHEESQNRKSFGFHTELLSHRVMEAYKWLRFCGDTESLAIGLFGNGDGSEAALLAASRLQRKVGAVVINGGWIDLSATDIAKVKSPTLFITDVERLEESLQARALAEKLTCEYHFEMTTPEDSLGDDSFITLKTAELARGWFSWFLDKD